MKLLKHTITGAFAFVAALATIALLVVTRNAEKPDSKPDVSSREIEPIGTLVEVSPIETPTPAHMLSQDAPTPTESHRSQLEESAIDSFFPLPEKFRNDEGRIREIQSLRALEAVGASFQPEFNPPTLDAPELPSDATDEQAAAFDSAILAHQAKLEKWHARVELTLPKIEGNGLEIAQMRWNLYERWGTNDWVTFRVWEEAELVAMRIVHEGLTGDELRTKSFAIAEERILGKTPANVDARLVIMAIPSTRSPHPPQKER